MGLGWVGKSAKKKKKKHSAWDSIDWACSSID